MYAPDSRPAESPQPDRHPLNGNGGTYPLGERTQPAYPSYSPYSPRRDEVAYAEPVRYTRPLLHIPTEKPLLTYVLLGMLVAVYLLMILAAGSITNSESVSFLVKWGAKLGTYIVDRGEWWRLITATFLHGSILHIAFNGYALYVVGSDTEVFFGRARFLAIYAVSGLGGSLASLAFEPLNVAGVGASGAIFGVIGALAVYFGLHRKLFGDMGRKQFQRIMLVIAINLAFGFSAAIFNVDNYAHLGGLLTGAAVGYALCPRYTFGEWETPGVRRLLNVNRGTLPWVAALLISLDVVMATVVVIQLLNQGIIAPNLLRQ